MAKENLLRDLCIFLYGGCAKMVVQWKMYEKTFCKE
jgi:hypothetical protein